MPKTQPVAGGVVVGEEGSQEGMLNRVSGRVWLQIALRHIGLVLRLVYQYPVLRLVLGRTRARHLIVLGIAAQKYRVHVQDNAPIIEQPVANHLPNVELGLERPHGSVPCAVE